MKILPEAGNPGGWGGGCQQESLGSLVSPPSFGRRHGSGTEQGLGALRRLCALPGSGIVHLTQALPADPGWDVSCACHTKGHENCCKMCATNNKRVLLSFYPFWYFVIKLKKKQKQHVSIVENQGEATKIELGHLT